MKKGRPQLDSYVTLDVKNEIRINKDALMEAFAKFRQKLPAEAWTLHDAEQFEAWAEAIRRVKGEQA